MRYIVVLLFLFPMMAFAFQPIMVEPESSRDWIEIENPESKRMYYGDLNAFPHTYQIVSMEPFTLTAQVFEPAIEGAQQNHNLIVIKERISGRGVEEVARVAADGASWVHYEEPVGRDRYVASGEVETEVGPGVYRIEVSTARNEGKYMLMVGTVDDADLGYFETIARLYQVKQFFGKSGFSVVLTPIVYWPLLIFVTLVSIVLWYRKRYA